MIIKPSERLFNIRAFLLPPKEINPKSINIHIMAESEKSALEGFLRWATLEQVIVYKVDVESL